MSQRFMDIMDDDERRSVLAGCTRARFQNGAYVFHAGEAGDTLHMVTKGRVAVLAGGWGGDPITLAILGAGDVFGELAMLGDQRRTATIMAIEPTETMVLSLSDFERLRRRQPKLNDFLLRILAHQVQSLTRRVVEISEVPATKRVYRRLVEMADLFGVTTEETEVPVTQDQLASLACAQLRTVSKVLAEARRAQLIDTGRRRIRILDLDELRRRAH